MADPVREDGWYRVTETGWQPVPDTDAETEIAAGQGWDLVHVKAVPAGEEIPLF